MLNSSVSKYLSAILLFCVNLWLFYSVQASLDFPDGDYATYLIDARESSGSIDYLFFHLSDSPGFGGFLRVCEILSADPISGYYLQLFVSVCACSFIMLLLCMEISPAPVALFVSVLLARIIYLRFQTGTQYVHGFTFALLYVYFAARKSNRAQILAVVFIACGVFFRTELILVLLFALPLAMVRTAGSARAVICFIASVPAFSFILSRDGVLRRAAGTFQQHFAMSYSQRHAVAINPWLDFQLLEEKLFVVPPSGIFDAFARNSAEATGHILWNIKSVWLTLLEMLTSIESVHWKLSFLALSITGLIGMLALRKKQAWMLQSLLICMIPALYASVILNPRVSFLIGPLAFLLICVASLADRFYPGKKDRLTVHSALLSVIVCAVAVFATPRMTAARPRLTTGVSLNKALGSRRIALISTKPEARTLCAMLDAGMCKPIETFGIAAKGQKLNTSPDSYARASGATVMFYNEAMGSLFSSPPEGTVVFESDTGKLIRVSR